jgi:hypothetical protein
MIDLLNRIGFRQIAFGGEGGGGGGAVLGECLRHQITSLKTPHSVRANGSAAHVGVYQPAGRADAA